jgi:epimerase transport system membrane fusion protein
LKPTDREEVYVGQMARVRVHALNIRRRPMLEGRVVGVAADALTDSNSGVSSYLAEVELDSNAPTASYISCPSKYLLRRGNEPLRNTFCNQ